RDGPPIARRIDVLEQHLARQLFAALHDPGDATIGDADLDLTSALAFEHETNGRSLDRHVPVAQGREAEGSIFPRVLLVANPGKSHLEQPDDGRDNLLSRQAGLAHVTRYPAPDSGQCAREAQQARELVGVAN